MVCPCLLCLPIWLSGVAEGLVVRPSHWVRAKCKMRCDGAPARLSVGYSPCDASQGQRFVGIDREPEESTVGVPEYKLYVTAGTDVERLWVWGSMGDGEGGCGGVVGVSYSVAK